MTWLGLWPNLHMWGFIAYSRCLYGGSWGTAASWLQWLIHSTNKKSSEQCVYPWYAELENVKKCSKIAVSNFTNPPKLEFSTFLLLQNHFIMPVYCCKKYRMLISCFPLFYIHKTAEHGPRNLCYKIFVMPNSWSTRKNLLESLVKSSGKKYRFTF